MKGIVAKNSKNVTVNNNTFQDLDVGIELENVEGVASSGNKFIETPQAAFC